MTTAKKATLAFKTGETVVYPAHGLGLITAVEQQEVAGFRLQVFVIFFEKDRMTVRVPIAKVASVGMRKIAEPALVEKALVVLTSRARVKRGMWSRRGQEYEAKIKSGDLISVAEVVRDLYRSPEQAEASYSERTLYESALETLLCEFSAVYGITHTEALTLIEQNLAKAPHPVKGTGPEADTNAEDEAAA
ncbi:CarD family transcriptional regulator (plasmid) [Microvirga ossetica]|uniref:CarD family transcriptional regulator n=1 Tax=Microvirga ossetica TaxID=1882682 RepID=A0A1B2ESD2_9HYPH|nr:CarD family transcriptional regulator [Microvirga ossetica]ANY82869.1 CarD family transcriptional regulator [Microvirga ossetica]